MTVLAAAQSDPKGFVAGLERPVVVDEAQRAPGLMLAIKAAVDEDRRPGQFLLTGSAGVPTLPKLAESLAGRLEIQTLWPFSQGELEGADGGQDTFVGRLFAQPFRIPDGVTFGKATWSANCRLGSRTSANGLPRRRSCCWGVGMVLEAAGARFVRGMVLYTGDTVVGFGSELYAVPVARLWT